MRCEHEEEGELRAQGKGKDHVLVDRGDKKLRDCAIKTKRRITRFRTKVKEMETWRRNGGRTRED